MKDVFKVTKPLDGPDETGVSDGMLLWWILFLSWRWSDLVILNSADNLQTDPYLQM
jgi:hypothetical protein